jgi:hypothetical protein
MRTFLPKPSGEEKPKYSQLLGLYLGNPRACDRTGVFKTGMMFIERYPRKPLRPKNLQAEDSCCYLIPDGDGISV